MNALFVQFYFTDVVRACSRRPKCVRILGRRRSSSMMACSDPSTVLPSVWLTGLVPGDPYFDQAANLVLKKYKPRFDPKANTAMHGGLRMSVNQSMC